MHTQAHSWHTCIYIYIYMYVYVYICIYIHKQTHTCCFSTSHPWCAYMHTQRHIGGTHVHTYTHTHTHTYICINRHTPAVSQQAMHGPIHAPSPHKHHSRVDLFSSFGVQINLQTHTNSRQGRATQSCIEHGFPLFSSFASAHGSFCTYACQVVRAYIDRLVSIITIPCSLATLWLIHQTAHYASTIVRANNDTVIYQSKVSFFL